MTNFATIKHQDTTEAKNI